MIYSLLRAVGRVALRWYYSEVTIVGSELVSPDRPLLVVVNHPNALVDVLMTGAAVRRRLMFTAKATLFENPVAAAMLSGLGVLPLRRASDETEGKAADPSRNAAVFRAVGATLAQRKAILIFPEGKSHDEPGLAPLKTGAARMALHARDDLGVRGIQVLPVGLIFDRKDRPRSRAVAIVGEPIEIDGMAGAGGEAVSSLTRRIDDALRTLTVNHGSIADAERAWRLSHLLSRLLRWTASDLSSPSTLREQVDVLKAAERVRTALPATEAARLEQDLESLARRLDAAHIDLDDLAIDTGAPAGSVFVVRETLLLLFAGPIAVWGWLNHLIPFRLALVAGRRSRQSAADPAMRKIVAGAALVTAVYAMQAAVVAFIFGPWWGLGYLVSLPVAADINLRLSDRLRRARRRARTYLTLRASPALRDELRRDALELRSRLVEVADRRLA